MKVKVLFEDGICTGVYMDEEAQNANIDVTVIDFDYNLDSKTEVLVDELLNLESTSYSLTHCIEEEHEEDDDE